MITQCTQKMMDMINQKTLTALCNSVLTAVAMYSIGLSLAYAGYNGQNYNPQYDWYDPRFCCPLERDL